MKKILLSLLIGFVGIISFCNGYDLDFSCDTTTNTCNHNYIIAYNPINLSKNFSTNDSFNALKIKYYCYADDGSLLGYNTNHTIEYINANTSFPFGDEYTVMCYYEINEFYNMFGDSGKTTSRTIEIPDSIGGSCPECPEVNTGEILSGYILESEIDTNYCVGNGLCPNECGSGTDFSGDLQYSNIYINSILHPGKQNIFVDIPDYITRDYSSTGDDFNLYVGSGYDVDYINSIIDINSYRPDNKDFTDIFVGGLTLITPYIVAILFFYLVWRLLKRIFS